MKMAQLQPPLLSVPNPFRDWYGEGGWKEWKLISERISLLGSNLGCTDNTAVIQVYLPTEDAEDEEKEDFYH